MKVMVWLVMALATLAVLGLGGCANKGDSGRNQAKVACPPTDSGRILTCLSERQQLTRQQFKEAYKVASTRPAGGDAEATLELVCLSLHRYAGYRQFKSGVESLARYLETRPEDGPRLQGIHDLMLRIEREKTSKKVAGARILDEKEELEVGNRELQERNEVLEKGSAADQARIRELQQQIEELKNIETIIKTRER